MVDFKNAEELLALCSRNGQRISEVMKRRECDLGEVSMEQVCSRMQGVWEIMRQSALTPLHTPVKSVGGLIGGEAGKLKKHQSSGKSICGEVLGQGIAYAMAVLEVNASMGLRLPRRVLPALCRDFCWRCSRRITVPMSR